MSNPQNVVPKYIEKAIQDKSLEIKEKICNGMLYSIPIDMGNIDHLIVATYFLKQSEDCKRKLKDLSIVSGQF